MNTNRISLNTISPELKEKLLSGKVLISTALVSAGALTMISAKDFDDVEANITPATFSGTDECVEFKSFALLGSADSSLSFGDAFHTQRESLGPGGVFQYNNKFYNTYYKEEWDTLTDIQKKDYYNSIDKLIDYDTVTYKNNGTTLMSVKIDVNIDPETGDISVASLSPDVKIESITINMSKGKLLSDELIEEPETTEVTPLPGTGFDDPFFDELNDIIIDIGQTSVESTNTFEDEDNLVDPSTIEIDEDTPNVPETEEKEMDNLTDPSMVDIIDDDNLTDPSEELNNQSGNISEPGMDINHDDNMTNHQFQSSEITIDEADFDF